jgi:acyl-CoA reductase-like NAD-dependent aldehyde dehydrogenase
MMGNVVVWKPSDSQVFSAKIIIDIFKEAGVPDGVINVVFGDPVMISDTVFESRDFAGIHFTGSTHVFKDIWKNIGSRIDHYKTYPRIVGETGGKDFIVAHPSANVMQVVTGIIRGAFEFQGQKCSAASRAYIPRSLWPEVEKALISEIKTLKMIYYAKRNFSSTESCKRAGKIIRTKITRKNSCSRRLQKDVERTNRRSIVYRQRGNSHREYQNHVCSARP